MMNIQDFKKSIQQGIHIINFYADWCTPCKMLMPILEDLEMNFKNKVDFSSLNIDNKVDSIIEEYNITMVPTLLIFKNGRIEDKIIGFNEKETIESKINSTLNI